MLRSLFSSISGLRSHQTMMDVTGNNIANVNTAGYKTSQTVFKDTLSQVLQGAGAPAANNGGTNPAQVGLGVRVGGIATNFSQGNTQATGRSTDLLISGDGFFVVNAGGEQLFTRAGSLSFDANGTLTTPDGGVLQGWQAVDGVINTNAAVGPVKLPIGTLLPPQATTAVTVGGNLPGRTTSTDPVVTTIDVYDAAGSASTLRLELRRVDDATWQATMPDGSTADIAFGPDGQATTATIAAGALTVDVSGLTNFDQLSTATALSQDGSGVGSLQAFTIGADGTLNGVFTNGLKQPIAQLALATFNNAGGLEKAGNTMFRTSPNSGVAQIGTANTGGRGSLMGGSLEMSNVDLAQEFTNLIIAQRGFQANSRVMTSSDEILQELVNIKR
jgi:flagellar hook protein FlgE